MKRSWVGACGTVLVLAALPAAASAQLRSCNQVRPADARRIINASGQEITYFLDPIRMICEGGVVVEADSAVFNRAARSLQLVGHVTYRDTANVMSADWAHYIGPQDQLLARGNVSLRDLAQGSVVTGQELDYQRAMPGRPVSRAVVRGGRPHAIFRPASDTARGGKLGRPPPSDDVRPLITEPADTAPPVEVRADRMVFLGETLLRAEGAVELERGTTTGAADSARYDRGSERMTLMGRAWVADERYRLAGERIDALMEENELSEVLAESATRLTSEELTVTSERLRITFSAGTLERLEAWNPPGTSDRRAMSLARDFRLRADSIDARADSGRIREVRAVGRAFGETEPRPEDRRLPGLVARDWIQGDTIIGYFARAAPDAEVAGNAEVAAGDSAGAELERIVVIGGTGPALSLYRMEPEEGQTRRSINYMKAKRIILHMSQGDVERVEAEGPIEGMYLDPARSGEQPAAGGERPAPTRPGGGRIR